MILYHGSNVKVDNPKIIKSNKGKDFGFAFYLTPIKEQAERMALRKASYDRKNTGIVSVFEWEENKSKASKFEFKNADMKWLNFVINCRTNSNFKHNYDIVIGKIADDKVGETINFVMDGVITKRQALTKLKYQKINKQLAFCTDASIKELKYIKSYEVKI